MIKLIDRAGLRERGITYCNLHLLRLERAGKFPKRVYIGPQRVAWPADEINDWLTERLGTREIDAARASEHMGPAAEEIRRRSRAHGYAPRATWRDAD